MLLPFHQIKIMILEIDNDESYFNKNRLKNLLRTIFVIIVLNQDGSILSK